MFKYITKFKQNHRKRKFLKYEMFLITRKIWKHEVRISTLTEIKEGVRQLFDKTSANIRAIEDEIEKLSKKAEISQQLLKVLEIIRTPRPGETEKENQDAINLARTEAWQAEIGKLIELKHGSNRKEEGKELRKTAQEILKFYTTLELLRIDVINMKIQMEGKWSEIRQRKEEGIDQEIKQLQGNITGGLELKYLLKGLLKKGYWILSKYD